MKSIFVPVGLGCNISIALQELHLRDIAYPFDWVVMSPKIILLLLKVILSDTDLDEFCSDFFSIEKNSIDHCSSWMPTFVNTQYNIRFIHDDIKDIREKYTRRFKRLREHILSSDKITLLYTTSFFKGDKDTGFPYSNALVDIFLLVKKYNENTCLLSINGGTTIDHKDVSEIEQIIPFTRPECTTQLLDKLYYPQLREIISSFVE